MKTISIIFLFSLQFSAMSMNKQIISTDMGDIAVYSRVVEQTTPIIFLHGVYYDHHLWNYQVSRITNHTVITIDMPLHGASQRGVPNDWTLDDCANMLLDILDQLEYNNVIAIGHSWGSMTILRAAHQQPTLFQSIGFCNLPLEGGTRKTSLQFGMQHLLLPFRSFYTKQVAKAMYGKQQLKQRPELQEYLLSSMTQLDAKAVRQTDHSVIIKADDAHHLLNQLTVPALGLKGKEDYVPISTAIPYEIVEGGHVSPLEVPKVVFDFVQKVIDL